ncbi:MAG: tetratricopeptide repeat protein [Acidobacteriota bacterium]
MPDTSWPLCEAESETLDYLAGQAVPAERERIEVHIAQCHRCRQTITALAHLAKDESAEETKLINSIYDQTAQAARALGVKPHVQVASFQRQPSASLVTRKWLALAASLIILLIIGVVALTIWHERSATNAELATGMRLLREATQKRRPIRLRITKLDYAPYSTVRGSNEPDLDQRLSAAQGQFEAILSKNSNSVAARQALGRVLIAKLDYQPAITELEKAQTAQPNDAAILTDLAAAYAARAATGDLYVAIKYLNRALELEPTCLEALFNRALVYQQLERYDAARTDWQRYLAADPSSLWAEDVRHYLAEVE